ncbi:MAG: hypothetical protein CVU05_05085 [Bacteroidetes bacterium HGW-Bacteroidetes-21]|jgi:type IX secretion system PorP/SprF family membrane protein|nr:MAG: hypothetical protein CVU05_05085 [Bacteroidetes bacterium HGW-Bacteroidetes-21]
MKKLYIIIGLMWLSGNVFSQQQPMYSNYMFNGFLLNPAIAGTELTSPIRLTARQQWAGITDAPSTQALSGHTSLGYDDNYGVGGYIYNDKFGPISRIGIHGAFSYHLKINHDLNLSLGLSLSAFQYKISESNLNIINPNDAAITGKTESTWAPDANFGMYLYHQNYYVGLASSQLIQYKLKLGDYNNLGKMVRHYYITGGYKFDLGKEFELEPSVLLKNTEQTPMQLDANLRVYYKKNYWLAFSYRHKDASVAMIGFKIDRYTVGYAFDYTFSGLSGYSHGSHEIMVGFDLFKPQASNALI